MAYKGKYIDRSPCIRPAGIPVKLQADFYESMKNYTEEEVAEDIIRQQCYKKYKDEMSKSRPAIPFTVDDSITDLLNVETKKSRFVGFREKFLEDMYFKKPELGKVYPLDSKPAHINNENTCFGKSCERSESLYDLMLPNKSVEEVNREYYAWHDKYVLSHNHYLPSERISRGYKQPAYDPNKIFGCKSNVDLSGIMVKRCMNQCQHLVVIGKAQKSFIRRNTGRLGETINKHHELENKLFGKLVVHDKCNVQALIENIDPCIVHTNIIKAVSHINKVRRNLFGRHNYHMYDLLMALNFADEHQTGYLTLVEIIAVLGKEMIHVQQNQIADALKYYNIIENPGTPQERINIETFWKLLHIQYPLPNIQTFNILPKFNDNKHTTYRDLCSDTKKTIPPPKYMKAGSLLPKSINDELTTAGDLVTPDIAMSNGLVPSDFQIRRHKNELRLIFKRVLVENFDEVWDKTIEKIQPADNLLSVKELRDVMDQLRVVQTEYDF